MKMKLKKNDTVLVPVIIIAGKLMSFLFNALLGSYYGAGKISDAFIMAHTIPTILYEGIATALISCYIPVRSTLNYEAPEKIDDFNSNITTISVLLAILVTIVYFVFRHPLNRLYAAGFDDVSLNLLNDYTGILTWSIPFIGAYCIFRAHLQMTGKKAVSSLGQVITYVILIIATVFFSPRDISLAWATLAGNIVAFFIFLICSLKTGYHYRFYISFKESYIRTILLMIFPIFFSTLASELASIVDKFFASQYADGIVTSLTYGYQLSFSIQGIVSLSVLVIVFPFFAEKAAQNDFEGLNTDIYRSIDLITWIVLPLVIGGIIVSKPLIMLLYGHGNFTQESVNTTSITFSLYLLGVLPMCIKHVGDRVCYALKKTNYAMITTFVTVGMNIVLDYFMNKIWGYLGLIIATDISILLGSITTFILIKRDDKELSHETLFKSLIYPTICSAVMGLVIFAVRRFVFKDLTNSIVDILLSVVVGCVIYFGITMLFFKKNIIVITNYLRK